MQRLGDGAGEGSHDILPAWGKGMYSSTLSTGGAPVSHAPEETARCLLGYQGCIHDNAPMSHREPGPKSHDALLRRVNCNELSITKGKTIVAVKPASK